MDKKITIERLKSWGGLVAILLMGTVTMVVVTPHDADWTRHLRENRLDWFKDWMSDSIFEGEMLGGSDLPVIAIIVAGILYLLAWLPLITYPKIRNSLSFLIKWIDSRPVFKQRLNQWRPQLGLILMSSLCIAIFVNASKWVTGRARPKYVWEKGMDYSDWYQFGSYFIADGSFRGSFPSGHTATVISLMGLAYVLFFNTRKVWVKSLGVLTFCFTIASSVLMLLARSMSNAHWVSDSVMSVFAGWLIVHVIYFWLLKVPEQVEFYQERQQAMPLPFLYEMQYTFLILLIGLGIMASIIGLRALYLQNCPWLVGISPLGAAMIIFSFYLLIKLNKSKEALSAA